MTNAAYLDKNVKSSSKWLLLSKRGSNNIFDNSDGYANLT